MAALLLLVGLKPVAAQPICQITHYDEFSGLSQRLVKAIAQDQQGMIWIATWNGLNRFDGYQFTNVKPRVGDGMGVYTDRVNDIRVSASGLLWLRIDRRCVLFDPRTYQFRDVHKELEQQLKQRFEVVRMRVATDSTTVMELSDGRFLTLNDLYPLQAPQITKEEPRRAYKPFQNKGLSPAETEAALPSGHASVIYTGVSDDATQWIVLQDGMIYFREKSASGFIPYEERISVNDKLYFCTLDDQGNVWLRSGYGIHKLRFTAYPFRSLMGSDESQVRCIYRDSKKRIWLTTKESRQVRVYDERMQLQGFLNASGQIQAGEASFGHSVYCMLEDHEGNLWLGTKPDGLFLLPKGGAEPVHYQHSDADPWSISGNGVYDLRQDAMGRLWIATNDNGIDCMLPTGRGRFHHAGNTFGGYPQTALRARRLCFTHQGVLLVATTNGLVVADATQRDLQKITFRHHVGEGDRANSLGCVALMDVLEDTHHQVFLATESGGVDLITSKNLLDERLCFRHFNSITGFPTEVALSLMQRDDELWVTSNNALVRLAPLSSLKSPLSTLIGNATFHKRLRFSEAHPLLIDGNRCLFGLIDGGMMANLATLGRDGHVPRIAITSVSVQNRPDSLSVNSLDTLILHPRERNLTVNYAALEYVDASEVRYAFRLDDGEWTMVGSNRSATFLDMEPGTYRLQIRSTNNSGEWLDNVRTLTIIVKPTFWETPWATLLWLLLIAGVVYAVARTYLYIKGIKRKQHETLEAYLKLLERETHPQSQTHSPLGPKGRLPEPESLPRGGKPDPASADNNNQNPSRREVHRVGGSLSEADEAFMRRVMDFVEKHISDADVGIQDMADAAATSKTNLNRKMKSMLGVTPADFLRQSRIQRACQLLADTDRTITDIALSCGFADQNYFSKAFRAQKGVSPSAYRSGVENKNQE